MKNVNISNNTIYHDFMIKAPIEKAFRGISEPSDLINWWPLRCEGEAKLGAEYNFYFSEKYDWLGKVIKFANNSSFFIKMTRSGEDWEDTTFGFELKQEPSFVQIQFVHTGWPSCNSHFRTSSYCWAILLNGLKNYVEKGVIIPFSDRE